MQVRSRRRKRRKQEQIRKEKSGVITKKKKKNRHQHRQGSQCYFFLGPDMQTDPLSAGALGVCYFPRVLPPVHTRCPARAAHSPCPPLLPGFSLLFLCPFTYNCVVWIVSSRRICTKYIFLFCVNLGMCFQKIVF
uniref:Uncharacterized protein n=1 Tax=Physcomitrium patens TaxID=3218 RepID=A0A2K1JQG0_PHYPA|nr:hypothetical protein PHYPA_016144 [Physcomitrium patens]